MLAADDADDVELSPEDLNGYCVPYAPPKTPSPVPYNPDERLDFGEPMLPRPPPLPPVPSYPAPPPPAYNSKRRTVDRPYNPPNMALVVMRQRFARVADGREVKWYEYLMEHVRSRGCYGFPQATYRGHDDAPVQVKRLLDRVSQRGVLHAPPSMEHFEKCLQPFTPCVDGITYRLYYVNMRTTQAPRADRELRGTPQYMWVTESELSGNVYVGPPSACGQSLSPAAVRAIGQLPLNLRFASPNPPLVLYHGTSVETAHVIARAGRLLPAAGPAMLGPGVYLARWDKAVSFSEHDAMGMARLGESRVLRCIVFAPKMFTMTRECVCVCGCGKSFVDHANHYGAEHDMTYVPDNSLPATRRAEWCVRRTDNVIVDCMFVIPGSHP